MPELDFRPDWAEYLQTLIFVLVTLVALTVWVLSDTTGDDDDRPGEG